MERGYVWQGTYGRRSHLIPVLETLLNEQDVSSLEMLAIFVNNNPYNLEFFIVVYYDLPQKTHIDKMFTMFESAGLLYRSDIIALELFKEMGNRRFNSCALSETRDIDLCFSELFFFDEIRNLEEAGYYMKPYGKDKQVFISYSSMDMQEVECIIPYLNGQDFPVWFDKYSIPVSGSITDSIQNGIENSDAAILWVTSNFLHSKWCRTEMRTFIKKMIEDDTAIIMMLEDGIETQELPTFLRDIKYIRRNGRDVFELAREIIKALKMR